MVEDVISGVRDAFQDEQVDEQVLQDLKSVSLINILIIIYLVWCYYLFLVYIF